MLPEGFEAGPYADAAGEQPDIGAFRQGSPLSRWALSRYLVGRAIAESVGVALIVAALAVLAMAGLIWWAGSPAWAVLVGAVALGVLALRALLLGALRRLASTGTHSAVEAGLRAMVADTRSDVLRELRRIGLPGRTWTLPLLAVRFLGRQRRAATVVRLRAFDLDHVVPAVRVDELHLLLRREPGATGR